MALVNVDFATWIVVTICALTFFGSCVGEVRLLCQGFQ